MAKIIIATHVKFWNLSKGSEVRIHQLVEELSRARHELYLYFAGSLNAHDNDYLLNSTIRRWNVRDDGQGYIWSDFMVLKKGAWLHLIPYLTALFSRYTGKAPTLHRFRNKSLIHSFNEFAKNIDPKAIIIEYIRLAYLVEGLNNQQYKLFIDTHDAMSIRCESFSKKGIQHWITISKEEEAKCLSLFNVVIAIQHREAFFFQKLLPAQKIITIPYAVSPKYLPKTNQSPHVCLGFLAANSQENRTSIQWFLDHIWKNISNSRPHSKLLIGGTVSHSIKTNIHKNVILLGFVDDLPRFYQSIDIIINPILSGGGIKIKNIEALSYGLPLVTTSVGAEGFPAKAQWPFFVCNDPDKFYSQLIKLMDNESLRKNTSDDNLKYIKRYFSPSRIFSPLLKEIQEHVK